MKDEVVLDAEDERRIAEAIGDRTTVALRRRAEVEELARDLYVHQQDESTGGGCLSPWDAFELAEAFLAERDRRRGER